MNNSYYKPCKELQQCKSIDLYWHRKEYGKFFEGYLKIARETGYALAECQVGFCYLEGFGVEKDPEKALYWTRLSADHGDWDAQFNLGEIYEKGLCGDKNLENARLWYKKSAMQGHDLAVKKCRQWGIPLD